MFRTTNPSLKWLCWIFCLVPKEFLNCTRNYFVVCPIISFLPADLLRTNYISFRFWTFPVNECFIFSVLVDMKAQFRLITNWLNDITSDNKDIQIPSKHNKIYYTLPLLDYMFRLLGVTIRPPSELIQNYLIPSALLHYGIPECTRY